MYYFGTRSEIQPCNFVYFRN